jgi:hypothetical protein
VTTIPIVADLIGALPVDRWVYYCVDDFAAWPGLDGTALRRMEEDLIGRADVLIAASVRLRNRLAGMGRSPHLLTHGVDLDHWADVEGVPTPRELDGLPRPLIVFWGVIDRRMDTRFLERLVQDLDAGTILLVGPEQTPDPVLRRLARVRRLPALPYDRLPGLAREAAVLIMPYADLPVTQAMQPLKLKEYLATGNAVVARNIAANCEWEDCLDLVEDPLSFSQRVRRRLQTGVPPAQKDARRRLAGESWEVKARLFDQWLDLGEPALSRTAIF